MTKLFWKSEIDRKVVRGTEIGFREHNRKLKGIKTLRKQNKVLGKTCWGQGRKLMKIVRSRRRM